MRIILNSINAQIGIGAILNRLDQLELTASRVYQLEVKASEFDQLKVQVSNQQIKIDQLIKKNEELEDKLESYIAKGNPTLDSNDHSRMKNAVSAANTAGNKDFLPRSCYELKATSPTAQSGLYFIDPDGQINGDDPVQAYCDMDTSMIHKKLLNCIAVLEIFNYDETIGTTSILHDSEEKTSVTSCADAGCYTKQIKYNATLRQMLMLADISGSCQQYFKVI